MNIEIVGEKLALVAEKMKASKGSLELFGLFLRENAVGGLWDVVAAAPWLKEGERASIAYVAKRLRETLNDKEWAVLSRIVILEHGSKVVASFLERFRNRTGLVEANFTLETGMVIQRAYVVVAQQVTDESPRKTTKKPRRSKAGSQGPPPSS